MNTSNRTSSVGRSQMEKLVHQGNFFFQHLSNIDRNGWMECIGQRVWRPPLIQVPRVCDWFCSPTCILIPIVLPPNCHRYLSHSNAPLSLQLISKTIANIKKKRDQAPTLEAWTLEQSGGELVRLHCQPSLLAEKHLMVLLSAISPEANQLSFGDKLCAPKMMIYPSRGDPR